VWEGKTYGALTNPHEALPPYAIAHKQIGHVDEKQFVPFAFWRSVDASSHCFFVESFIDELAHAAGADPLAYRLGLLDGAARDVVAAARDMSGWQTGVDENGRAYGVALTYCFGSYVAQVASVSIEDGRPRVHDVWCAVDCGRMINPNSVVAQIQGGVIYGLSAALYGRIDIKDGAVVQSNFHDYPVVKMTEAPRVHVQVLQRDTPPQGVGEVGTPPIAPAVANAMAVLGDRRRRLPLIG
ncbi:MAG: molybdopterin cofactor-binding domain-containing protein, partial [Myxococcota bacterium]